MWAVSDEALLAGLAAGDTDAAAAFVRRFQRRVFGLALAVLTEPDAAEDAAQEAFVRAWRHAAAFDPRRGSVVTWLLAITRNTAIDALRMRRARPTETGDLPSPEVPSLEPSPEELAVTGQETERLRRAIAELPGDQRRALLLAAIYGRTAREICEADGIPLGTIKTRIRSAMMKLRATLSVERTEERTDEV